MAGSAAPGRCRTLPNAPADPQYRQRIVEWSKANRGELEGVYTGPANSKVRDHIYRIWMDILKKYQVDGMHFDYIRLASPDFDYSRTSIDNFHQWLKPLTGADRNLCRLPRTKDPLAATEMFKDKFADFQREQITPWFSEFTAKSKSSVRSYVSAAVFANDENAYTRRFQDWRRWLKMGILDVACPMAYTTDTEVFRKQVEVASDGPRCREKVWAGSGPIEFQPNRLLKN
jgi:uncharacterized lipoprotein YddW (UPF0748 family)